MSSKTSGITTKVTAKRTKIRKWPLNQTTLTARPRGSGQQKYDKEPAAVNVKQSRAWTKK